MLASRSATTRAHLGRGANVRRGPVRVQALFGWGKKSEEEEWKQQEKEEAYRVQQELLNKRRSGELIKEAGQRRKKVSDTLAARKAERKNERDMLAQGIMPESLANWRPYKNKKDEEATSGIVVPLLPFGIQKYDDGERFDLRSPYADDGWVDPEETDAFSGFKKLFNWGKKEETNTEKDKKIIWASDYERWKRENGKK